MNNLKVVKILVLATGLSLIAFSCVGTVKLGQYTAQETYQDPKVVALVEAAWKGDAEKVAKLAAEGVDVNSIGKDGVTPLMWALKNKSFAGAEALLKAGADPNLYVPEFGAAAIQLMAGGNEPKMLALLLQYGGNPNDPGNGTLRDRPLWLAASQGRIDNVKMLIAAGAELNAHDEYGASIATATLGLAKFEVLAYLLEQGFNHDLARIARGVARREVPDDSEAQQWKLKVIELLKARGVKIPEQQN
jgi:hypothetical protein